MRVESGATALSWIPSEAVSGLTKAGVALRLSDHDDPPPATIADTHVLADAYRVRLANRLRAWAEFSADGMLTGHGVDGGIVMGRRGVRIGPLGGSFAAVGMPVLRPAPVAGIGWVRFRQTCGGRMAVPLPRRVSRTPCVRLQAPLVWTTVELTLHADGRAEPALVAASAFPRHWVYGGDGALTAEAGITDWAGWMEQPVYRQTPWGAEDSPVVGTVAETALEHELSLLVARGGPKPVVRKLPAGVVLARQGEYGEELYLLLDGVVAVERNDERLAELGPGALLGERAVLEGGVRTATLTAVTRVRVAVVGTDAVDRAALVRLAAGHRHEEARG